MPISYPLNLSSGPSGPLGPSRRPKHPIFCANCGGIGHIYKNCNHPVTSYGIICYRLVLDPQTNSICPLYLMVQRKDSMSYVEFLRGKYQLENKSYLMKLFSNMTKEEHARIQHASHAHIPFEKLWKDLWQVQDCRSFEKEFLEARTKYDILKQGYYLSGSGRVPSAKDRERDSHNESMVFFSLKELLQQAPAIHDTTEWGFPKGRRNINEDDIHCALREFSEETGYMTGQIKIHMDVKPMEEIFSGTNRVRYKHVYYLAQLAEAPPLIIPSGSIHSNSSGNISIVCDARKEMRGSSSVSEIRDVKWFTYHDAQAVLRNYNIERKELFRRVNHNVLKNLYAYSKRFTTHAIAP